VDRLTRHQLKQDEFRDSLVSIEEYFKKHYKEIVSISTIVIVVVGLAVGLKVYTDRQDAAANADLGEALTTFRAYVGQPTPGEPGPAGTTFPTAQDKYKKALEQFNAIVDKYKMPPRPKAAEIALYQAGVCQALLGDESGAVNTLTAASQGRDQDIDAMAKFALAGELARAGKTDQAVKLYQDLADHPTITVPRASALLGMAGAFRATKPDRARQIYEQVQKEFASDSTISEAVKQEIASLNP